MHTEASPRSPLDVTLASPCTCLRLRKLSRQLTNLYDQHLAPFGLTVTQFSLLAHLGPLEGIGVGALADAMVMDPTALTRALRPLQRDGLVRLATAPGDKRARAVHLTPEGRERFDAARPAWRQAQLYVNDLLQASDAPAFNRLLDGLIARMKSAPTGFQPTPYTASGKDSA